jgi:hypothetical protein
MSTSFIIGGDGTLSGRFQPGPELAAQSFTGKLRTLHILTDLRSDGNVRGTGGGVNVGRETTVRPAVEPRIQ